MHDARILHKTTLLQYCQNAVVNRQRVVCSLLTSHGECVLQSCNRAIVRAHGVQSQMLALSLMRQSKKRYRAFCQPQNWHSNRIPSAEAFAYLIKSIRTSARSTPQSECVPFFFFFGWHRSKYSAYAKSHMLTLCSICHCILQSKILYDLWLCVTWNPPSPQHVHCTHIGPELQSVFQLIKLITSFAWAVIGRFAELTDKPQTYSYTYNQQPHTHTQPWTGAS